MDALSAVMWWCLFGGLSFAALALMMSLVGAGLGRIGAHAHLGRHGRLPSAHTNAGGRGGSLVRTLGAKVLSNALALISPMGLALFAVGFGASGLAALAFHEPNSVAMAVGCVFGIGFALGVMNGVAKFLESGETSSHVHQGSLLGLVAEVVVTIPRNGAGQIQVRSYGCCQTMPARWEAPDDDSRDLVTGSRARIVRYENGTAYVCRLNE